MKFQMWESKDDGEWYWRLRAKNGEIIAHGEGYKNKGDCLRCIQLVKECDRAEIELIDGQN